MNGLKRAQGLDSFTDPGAAAGKAAVQHTSRPLCGVTLAAEL